MRHFVMRLVTVFASCVLLGSLTQAATVNWAREVASINETFTRGDGDSREAAIVQLKAALEIDNVSMSRAQLNDLLGIVADYCGSSGGMTEELEPILLLFFRNQSRSHINYILSYFGRPELAALSNRAKRAEAKYKTPTEAEMVFAKNPALAPLEFGEKRTFELRVWNADKVLLGELATGIKIKSDNESVVKVDGSAGIIEAGNISGKAGLKVEQDQGWTIFEQEVLVDELILRFTKDVERVKEFETVELTLESDRDISSLGLSINAEPEDAVRLNYAAPAKGREDQIISVVAGSARDVPVKITASCDRDFYTRVTYATVFVDYDPAKHECKRPSSKWVVGGAVVTVGAFVNWIAMRSRVADIESEANLEAARGASQEELDAIWQKRDSPLFWQRISFVGWVAGPIVTWKLWDNYRDVRAAFRACEEEKRERAKMKLGFMLLPAPGVQVSCRF